MTKPVAMTGLAAPLLLLDDGEDEDEGFVAAGDEEPVAVGPPIGAVD